jgi:choline transport protein
VTFILGLLQSTFSLTAFDGAAHLCEEMCVGSFCPFTKLTVCDSPNPIKNVPKVMVLAVVMGASTAFVFVIVLMFVIKDFDAVVSAVNPLLEIYYQATSNRAGATCLLIFNLVAFFMCTQG